MEHLAAGTYTVVGAVTLAHGRDVPHYGLLDRRVVDIAEGEVVTVDFEFTSDDPPLIEGILIGLHPEEGAWVNVYRGEIAMPVPFGWGDSTSDELLATQYIAAHRRDIKI
jgi:hypothetical protein